MNAPFVTFDDVAHAIYVRFTGHDVASSIALSDSVFMDVDDLHAPIGIEILHADSQLEHALRNTSGGARLNDLLAWLSCGEE